MKLIPLDVVHTELNNPRIPITIDLQKIQDKKIHANRSIWFDDNGGV
jgi:hypothetical protein